MTTWHGRLLLIVCLQFVILLRAEGKQNVEVVVRLRLPPLARQGDSVSLLCEYQLSNTDHLYSVQWYKEGEEFYRYTPGTTQRKQTFPVKGIEVDVAASDANRLRLKEINQKSSGQFRCEISLEAPSFDTFYDYGDMIVVVGPQHGPSISGVRPGYREGEQLHLNCTLAGTKPAAALNWYINSRKALPSQLVEHAPVRGSDGLETVTLGLRVPLTADLAQLTRVKVNCTAAVANAYWESRLLQLPVTSLQKLAALESSYHPSSAADGVLTTVSWLSCWPLALTAAAARLQR